MKRIIFLCLSASLFLLASELSRSVVLIKTDKRIGTGVLISKDGKILTSYHVIKDTDNIKVSFKENELKFYGAKLLKKDPKSDLALIKLIDKKASEDKAPVSLSCMNDIKLDDKVSSLAHTNKALWQKSNGRVYQILKDHSWRYKDDLEHKVSFIIQARLLTEKGISGSPLVDEKNRLIGLNTFDDPRSKNVVYAVSIYDIKEFLFKN